MVGDRITDERHKDTIPELAPGDQRRTSISIPRRLLHADDPGVYWFGVHALGEGRDGRDQARRRPGPHLPPAGARRPGTGQRATAVVIPLRHQLVYTDDGSLDDLAGWTQTLSQGGRLRSLVDFGASSGDRTVTWVVDPGLVDAVRRLADGNPPRSLAPNLQVGQDGRRGRGVGRPLGEHHPDRGADRDPDGGGRDRSRQPARPGRARPVVQAAAQAAKAWLARLGEAMRPEDQVMALPYGDVDVAAAASARPAASTQRAVARAGTTLPGFDVTTSPVLSSPSGYLTGQAIRAPSPGSTILLTDAMFAGAGARRSPTPRATTWSSTSTAAARAARARTTRRRSPRCGSGCCREAAVRFLPGRPAAAHHGGPARLEPARTERSSSAASTSAGCDLTTVQRGEPAGTPTSVDGATAALPAAGRRPPSSTSRTSTPPTDADRAAGPPCRTCSPLNNVVSGTVDRPGARQRVVLRPHPAHREPRRPPTAVPGVDRDAGCGRVRIEAPRAVTLSSASGRFPATVTNDLDQPVTVTHRGRRRRAARPSTARPAIEIAAGPPVAGAARGHAPTRTASTT